MTARAFFTLLLAGAVARAEGAPPPPAAERALPPSVVLPSSRAREPLPEAEAIKVRLNGEYELRQSFLTALPLPPYEDGPAHLEQTSRLFHWLRLRSLLLVFESWALRGEVDLPRGMVYGRELEGVRDHGTDFERSQPLRLAPRMLKVTGKNGWGELSVGHTTVHSGMGLLDNDGDQPRWFGTPDRAPTYERVELLSGDASSALRVGVSGDLVFAEDRLSLLDGDRKWRVALSTRFAPTPRASFALQARYEALQARGGEAGASSIVLDASGGFRSALPGRAGELFGEYEGVYRLGDAGAPTSFAQASGEHLLASLAFATRIGFALESVDNHERYAPVVAAVEWGMASGDADPTDDEQHRFVMSPNHGVGLLLFSEILRFKTARAQTLLAEPARRSDDLATRGGVAGAGYLSSVLLLRPSPEVTFKLGALVASATSEVVDPAALSAEGQRRNFDGGSVLGRSLGSELNLGAELRQPLQPSMQLRLSLEGGVAFPGSAFHDSEGNGLGTQALASAGLGLTF